MMKHHQNNNQKTIRHCDLFPKEKREIGTVIRDTGKHLLIDIGVIIMILLIFTGGHFFYAMKYSIFIAYLVQAIIFFSIERLILSTIIDGDEDNNSPKKRIEDISEGSKYGYYARYCSINAFLCFTLFLIFFSALGVI